MLTQERLKVLLCYDPLTGIFTYRVERKRGTHPAGSVAGKVEDGYRRIKIDGKMYRAHRLAWLYVHGHMPRRVDHRDNIGDHNWIENLRPCTQSQNCANRVTRTDNKLGIKGVHFHKAAKRFVASIGWLGKMKHLGCYDTAEEAHEVYCLAADMLHGEFANHGASV
ncbi:HNH endonuclease [Paraburkholderia rhynchosiae]|uniref:HNH nuclease domain-containing protein n=1 Tax=Paraburkholderia rhynchosiae TaxID=487049 RepID=A0A2N7W9C1_9BURK|nr:HNH endonuclease [Paraburkholderia rhynchosiae]PMS25994.1 hypothetical protein C0Z16_28075 [Paraburkholderia rhynchosiae]CAB3730963.1 hypothetical protein LMG27174_05794 [Paraburkholderia rhynchosiae]